MKVKHLSALAGLAGTALIASPASAGFTGFSIEVFDVGVDHANVNVRNAWNGGGGAGLDSYRIYATFDSSGDEIQGVFGDSGRRAFLTVSGTIFNVEETTYTFGAPLFYNTPTFGGAGFATDPARGWDTFVTIGRFVNDTLSTFSTGADAQTNNLNDNWDSDNDAAGIAWTVTGAPPQAIVPADGRVLIMQLTVSAGSAIDGNFGIQFNDGVSVQNIHDDVGEGGISHFSVIPSPGAFALLGLAGLTGVRRRRRH